MWPAWLIPSCWKPVVLSTACLLACVGRLIFLCANKYLKSNEYGCNAALFIFRIWGLQTVWKQTINAALFIFWIWGLQTVWKQTINATLFIFRIWGLQTVWKQRLSMQHYLFSEFEDYRQFENRLSMQQYLFSEFEDYRQFENRDYQCSSIYFQNLRITDSLKTETINAAVFIFIDWGSLNTETFTCVCVFSDAIRNHPQFCRKSGWDIRLVWGAQGGCGEHGWRLQVQEPDSHQAFWAENFPQSRWVASQLCRGRGDAGCTVRLSMGIK